MNVRSSAALCSSARWSARGRFRSCNACGLAMLLVASTGCKSPPTNPFAQQVAADRAKATTAGPQDATSEAAKTSTEVAQSGNPQADPVTTLKAEAAEISQLGKGLAGAAAGLARDSQAAAKDTAA